MSPFETYIAPAKHKPELWRIFATCISFFALYALFTFGFFAGLSAVFTDADQIGLLTGTFNTPNSMLALLASFIGWIGALLIPLWLLHKRGLVSLLGARASKLAVMFVIGFAGYAVFLFLLSVAQSEMPRLDPNLDRAIWLRYLLPGLLLLLIQVSAEELLFRGYLQQQIAVRFNSVALALILPSLLFGAGHFNLDNGLTQGLMLVAITTLLGLMLAEITRRTGNLGAAIGIHFLNNMTGMFFVSFQDFAGGLALYQATDYIENPDLFTKDLIFQLYVFASLTAAYFAFRFFKSRKK